ncbi:hypothetical protein M2T82_08995 [Elizabethkingia ursingii]|uniref:hypothetical protein n=1 Tax=Elizabethkingia ursingii TaxID=1756150 RepID=UPI00201246CE|nr:hypothetical protein [Elizabethkingia ursingii]MCL1668193.1 hypothetical protein [Elizabethkingia ursingii]
MKINPILIFNILIALFLVIGVSVTVLIIRNGMNPYYITASIFSNLLLLFILYSINKGIPSSHKVMSTIEKNKDRLEFNESGFIVNSPVMQYRQIIEWHMIEAIYCLNTIPLDGTYHNFEYSIFLSQPAKTVKYSNLSWYNKLFASQSNSLEIKINDYSNIDFNKLHPAIEKYLLKEEIMPEYLQKKFGNDSLPKDLIKKSIKAFGLYKVYDIGNSTHNEKLKEYRANATKA